MSATTPVLIRALPVGTEALQWSQKEWARHADVVTVESVTSLGSAFAEEFVQEAHRQASSVRQTNITGAGNYAFVCLQTQNNGAMRWRDFHQRMLSGHVLVTGVNDSWSFYWSSWARTLRALVWNTTASGNDGSVGYASPAGAGASGLGGFGGAGGFGR